MSPVERKAIAVLRVVRDDVRNFIHTEPDHALYPNHRADEFLRDLLEMVLHESE